MVILPPPAFLTSDKIDDKLILLEKEVLVEVFPSFGAGLGGLSWALNSRIDPERKIWCNILDLI